MLKWVRYGKVFGKYGSKGANQASIWSLFLRVQVTAVTFFPPWRRVKWRIQVEGKLTVLSGWNQMCSAMKTVYETNSVLGGVWVWSNPWRVFDNIIHDIINMIIRCYRLKRPPLFFLLFYFFIFILIFFIFILIFFFFLGGGGGGGYQRIRKPVYVFWISIIHNNCGYL